MVCVMIYFNFFKAVFHKFYLVLQYNDPHFKDTKKILPEKSKTAEKSNRFFKTAVRILDNRTSKKISSL